MKTTKKLLAIFMAVVLICSFAFSASAADTKTVKDTKTYTFLKNLQSSRTITASVDDINEGSISVTGIKAVAKINESNIDLKAKATVKLGSISANALYEGGKLVAYLSIFKVDVTDLLSNYIDISSIMSQIDVEDVNDILDMADDDVLNALKVDSATDTVEKFSVSPVLYLTSVAGVSETELWAAIAASGATVTVDSSDAEIKAFFTEAAKNGTLANILVALNKYDTVEEAQADMDTLVQYMNSNYEFDYSGEYVTNIVITGDMNFNLKESLGGYNVKVAAGDQGLGYTAPSFAIDITSFAKGILKLVMNMLGA